MGGGFVMYVRMPGTCASFGRRPSMMLSTFSARSSRGFRSMNTRPELLAPTLAPMRATFGSAAKIAAISCWCRIMSSKPTPCAASVLTLNRLTSSLGRKPFGVIMKKYTVATSSTTEMASVTGRNSRLRRSVRSYKRSQASNIRSIAR